MAQESYIQQLANYIKQNLARGYTLDSLKFALEAQDYSRSAIERAIRLANEQLAKTAPQMKEKPRIKYRVVHNKDIIQEQKAEKTRKKSFLRRLFG